MTEKVRQVLQESAGGWAPRPGLRLPANWGQAELPQGAPPEVSGVSGEEEAPTGGVAGSRKWASL